MYKCYVLLQIWNKVTKLWAKKKKRDKQHVCACACAWVCVCVCKRTCTGLCHGEPLCVPRLRQREVLKDRKDYIGCLECLDSWRGVSLRLARSCAQGLVGGCGVLCSEVLLAQPLQMATLRSSCEQTLPHVSSCLFRCRHPWHSGSYFDSEGGLPNVCHTWIQIQFSLVTVFLWLQ